MPADPRDVVDLAVVPSEFAASMIVAALEDRGIKARAVGGVTSGFRAEAPGHVKVIVHRADLERGRAALLEYQQESSDVDWSRIDIASSES